MIHKTTVTTLVKLIGHNMDIDGRTNMNYTHYSYIVV